MTFFLLIMVIFVSSIQPILMVLVLMFMTLFCSINVMIFLGDYWFSYILMLVVLSGIMILFMYVSSLIPNESFEMLNLFLFFFVVYFFVNEFFFEVEMSNSIVSLNLWVCDLNMYNLYLVLYLFSLMVGVVWITCFSKGSVRLMYFGAWLNKSVNLMD